MSCLGRIGCGLLLIVLGAAGWHYRDVWLARLRGVATAQMPWEHAEWRPISPEGALRAEGLLARLDRRTGPAFVNVEGADLVAYALRGALPGILAMDSLPEALVDDGQVYLRMRVRVEDLGNPEAVGTVAGLFAESEVITIAGRLTAVRPGLASYQPTDVAVKDLRVPPGAISRLLGRWGPAERPEGVPGGALPIPMPSYVGDLRVGGGRVTLYRAGR